MLVYVDDILITRDNNTIIETFIRYLGDTFALKDLGEITTPVVASIILAPSLFLVTYLCHIMLSPWYVTIWSLFTGFVIGFQRVLRSIPTIFIRSVNRNQGNIKADSPHQDDRECNCY